MRLTRIVAAALILSIAAPVASEDDKRALVVKLLDRQGNPVPGQQIELLDELSVKSGRRKIRAKQRTGLDGIARFPGRTPADGYAVLARYVAPRPDVVRGLAWNWSGVEPLTDWVTEIRSEVAMPLDVLIFDAETGARMSDVKWGTGWIGEDAKPQLVGGVARAEPGDDAYFGFHLDVPAGYVALEPTTTHTVVADNTRRLVLHYPLHREVLLDATVRTQAGQPQEDRKPVFLLYLGERKVSVRAEARGAGRYTVQGVPRLRGERFVLYADAFHAVAKAEFVVPDDPGQRVTVGMTLDPKASLPPAPEEYHGTIGIGGGQRPPGPSVVGELSVRCLLADGTPAARTSVFAEGPKASWRDEQGKTHTYRFSLDGTTDEHGRAVWKRAAVGTWTVVFDAWHRKVTASAVVREGQRSAVEVREPVAGQAEVIVTGEDGRPLPFATLFVRRGKWESGWRPVPDSDGIQRADRRADGAGRRLLRRIYPGTHRFYAEWGGREGHADAAVRSGETATVRIVLRPPK